MSYVDTSLLNGEKVTYRTHLHQIMFLFPICCELLLLPFMFLPFAESIYVMLAAIVLAAIVFFTYSSSEFAVTNKRVIIKVGVLKTRTLEMLLSKVETVAVTQGVFGRMLGYGTIVVTGTGGTHEPFRLIADPLGFRRAVQAATT